MYSQVHFYMFLQPSTPLQPSTQEAVIKRTADISAIVLATIFSNPKTAKSESSVLFGKTQLIASRPQEMFGKYFSECQNVRTINYDERGINNYFKSMDMKRVPVSQFTTKQKGTWYQVTGKKPIFVALYLPDFEPLVRNKYRLFAKCNPGSFFKTGGQTPAIGVR